MARLSAHGFPVDVSDYQALGLLGQGASGQVFKARQRSTGQFVAVKIPAAATDAAAQRRLHQRLHRETFVLAMLHHTRIVRLIDKGMAGTQIPFAVMEYVPGVTLRDFLRQRGPLSLPVTMELMAQLLDALACLHMHGVVHRDLKPENVMVTSEGAALHLKLLDFGLASRGNAMRLRATPAGTPAYCAPEQLRGEHCTSASDIYAWALMFAECLGTRPLVHEERPGQPPQRRQWKSAAALPKPLRGTSLVPLLLRALQEDVRLRAGNAAQLYAELLRCPEPAGSAAVAPWQRASSENPVDHPCAASPAQALQATQDPANATACPGQAQAFSCAILCLTVRLHIGHKAGLTLDSLQAIREQQLHWCKRAVQSGLGQEAGSLGDCMVFHFDRGVSSLENLLQAASLAQDICRHMRRRSRMLEFQHGVRLDIFGGMHATTSLHHDTSTAIHFNGLATAGSIVLSPSAHDGLAGSGQTETYLSAGQETLFRLKSVPAP